jgi:hypothetical protein
MVRSGNTEVEHMIKQGKRKNLSDEMVYSSLGKKVEMHRLGLLKLSNFDNKTIDELFTGLIEENVILNKRVDSMKKVISDLNSKIVEIESRLTTYGLK